MKLVSNKKLARTNTTFGSLLIGEFFNHCENIHLKVNPPMGINQNTVRLHDCYLLHLEDKTVILPITAEIHHEPINNE